MDRKAAFLTDLDRRHIRGARNRLLAELGFYSAKLKRVITVEAGFEYDGMSVPWWVPYGRALLVDVGHKGSAIHDWMYANPHLYTRDDADAVLREALEVEWLENNPDPPPGAWNRVKSWTRRAWGATMRAGVYVGVRSFGGLHYGDDPPPLPPVDTSTDSFTGD